MIDFKNYFKYLTALILTAGLGSACLAQPQNYTSRNNKTQNWEDNSTWTKSEVWMADNPGTSLNSNNVTVYGKTTRTGDLTNGGSTVFTIADTLTVTGSLSNGSTLNVPVGGLLTINTDYNNPGGASFDIYGTVIVRGNLTTTTNIHVHTGGLLIVLGNLTVTNAGAAGIINEGNTVAVGEVSIAGDVTTNDKFYIYDNTPTYDWGGTIDGTDYNGGGNNGTLTGNFPTESDIPQWLGDILTGLGVTCGGLNTISSPQTICISSAPATLTGTAISGVTYRWERSTSSATTGFSNAAGTINGQNYTAPVLTQTTWFRRVVINGACSAPSAAVRINVFNGRVWTGSSNNGNLGTLGNWCGGLPGPATDVLIPAGRTSYPSTGYPVSVLDLVIEAGASVQISNSGTLSIYGDLENTGTLSFQNTTDGTIAFSGATTQTVNGGPYTFNNMTVNNTTGSQIVFSSDVTVNRLLTLTAGVINLSNSSRTFTIGTSSSNANGGASAGALNYTNGRIINARLTRYLTDGSKAAFLFPMGTATNYRPFQFTTTTNIGTGGTMTVLHTALGTVTAGLTIADGTSTIERRQNDSWTVSTSNMVGGTYSIMIGGTGFGSTGNPTDLRVMRQLVRVPSSTHVAATGGITDFRAQRIGLDLATLTGGALYVGSISPGTPLPIKLTSFTAEASSTGVMLAWSTSMEKSFSHFDVEHAGGDLNFNSMARVAGRGGLEVATHYAFEHKAPVSGKNYYRLKSYDLDGTSEYSNVITADWSTADIEVYPNPTVDGIFTLLLSDKINAPAHMQLLNSLGDTVVDRQIDQQSSEVQLPDSIKPGIYILRISVGAAQETLKLVVH